ncbi:toxin-antitoxin system YwqK family antitoxin [Streptomyces sp. NPDC056347]|uniref:toxin-antitoxin system YwqK family antitoxin n=1 Tax=Streptomyces sp. NPDC056347 TaxID=3345790 RepID=UPI0035D9A506
MNPVVRIDVDDPDVDMDDAQRVLYLGEPFTGEVAEYQSGHLISLEEHTGGIPNGLSRDWYQDGTLSSEGVIRNGRPSGEFKEWHPSGVVKSRKFFDGSLTSLREEETWDECGNLLTSWHRDKD